ncbi:MAG: hypothetical protein ACLGI3_08080, partial [Actinomycetes bacterium]
MSFALRQTRSQSPARWIADRPLVVKFGVLLAAVFLSCAGVLGSMLVGNAAAQERSTQLSRLNEAEVLVLQLDTRASELRVDGTMALVRPAPAEQLSELADDITSPEGLLEELGAIQLDGESAETVEALRESFGSYTDAISAFADQGIADQAGTRLRWQDIQAAKDLTHGALSAAK